MIVRDKLYIDGQWVAPSAAPSIDVHRAGDGAVMGTVPAGAAKDIDAAVNAARNALPGWSALP
ncbi:MAG: aldehyde dehydrogenase family protein, partial [Betaproteobacteria bacterium]